MKAKSEVSGTEANAALQKELRLASSETATKTTAEIKILRAYDHMGLLTPNSYYRDQWLRILIVEFL